MQCPHYHWIIPVKSTKSFMKEFTFICVHAWETNTHARVNLYEMSTYKSCWSWSVSQFSTCMSLLRHGCQRNSYWNSQTDGQMYTFPDQMSWQFVQILMVPNSTQNFVYFDFFENLLSIVPRLSFFCSTSSVSGSQNKSPNFHHNHPCHPFIAWMYRECKAQNGFIL